MPAEAEANALPALNEHLRTTAFRLAVRYALFFALSTVAIFAVTYHAAGRHLLEASQASISAELTDLRALLDREDLIGLAEEI